MSAKIGQSEVNCVASFVEACMELEHEPFFGKDEKLSFGGPMNQQKFILGDRFHFRSALISFRRIWMPEEPSSWKRILPIIYNSSLPNEIVLLAKQHEQEIQYYLKEDKHIFNVRMSGERIVDLWLNTVFAHGGIEGKNQRSDFELAVNEFGHGAFEWCFRHIVKWVGKGFLEIASSAAKPALAFYQNEFTLSPSFKISAAFGTKRKEKTKEGHIIIREGSSEYFTEETFEERYSRILSRDEHHDLQYVFQHLDCNPTEMLRAILSTNSLSKMMATVEGRLEIQSLEKLIQIKDVHPRALNWVSATRNFPQTQYPIHIYEDRIIVTNEKGLAIAEKLLANLRVQLLGK
jgi:hypothetical protein